MFFQPPPAGAPSPWSLGSYRSHDILIWVMIIFAVIMAFFLLMQYFNTRKGSHLMWGLALILTFISFHQVANTGNYGWLLESWGSGIMVMIPALIAGGILLATFESKPKVAQLFLLAMGIVAILVTLLGLGTIQGLLDIEDMVFENWRLIRLAITMVAVTISVGVMLVIPIYTTLISKETTAKAYLMVIAAILLLIWIIGYAISMTLVKEFVDTYNAGPAAAFNGPIENIGLFYVFGLFPYIFIFSTVFAVLGVHYESKWTFSIPGVDVEDETRIEKMAFQRSKPLISSALGVAGGVLLLLGAVLAAWINISQSIVNMVLVGILMIGGLLGALVGFAALISWKQELFGREISNYLKIALGALTLISAIILLLLPTWVYYYVPNANPMILGTWEYTGDLMTLPAIPVFLLPEGQIWVILGMLLIIIGPVLILAGGILSEFVFKEE